MTHASFLRKIRWIILIAFSAIASSAHPTPGDLYISQPVEGIISKFKPDGTKSTFASGLDNSGGLAFDRAGNLFVSSGGIPGSILKLTPSGDMSVFASDLSLPGALAFDRAGNLYATENSGDTGGISKFTPDGGKSAFGSYSGMEQGIVYGLAFSLKGNLFATTGGPFNFNGGIIWFAPDGTGHDFTMTNGPALAFDTAGNLFVNFGDDIVKYTPLPNGRSVFGSDFNGPTSLAFDSAGNLFVAESKPPADGSIVKVTQDGTKTTFASGLGSIGGLAFEPILEKLRNISARGLVGTGDDALIGGFIVGGNALANNAVVVRAIGPSLSKAGVSNALADPTLELHDASGALVASNDNWQDTQEEQITATGLAPTDPNEAAIYATLPAGNYTAVVRGDGDTTGVVWSRCTVLVNRRSGRRCTCRTMKQQRHSIALFGAALFALLIFACDANSPPGSYTVFVESNNGTSFGAGLFEIYELEGGADQQTRLVNISTRCLVRTGDEVAIAGVILSNPTSGASTTLPRRSLLMLGKGPILGSLGISGYLADPFLTLKNSAGTTMSTNNNWGGLAKPLDELMEQNLAPNFSAESALWPFLSANTSYTAILSGVSNGTGIGLIEMYEY